ncbi:MAG TPA: hypothetical protein VI197_13895 [Polyangiaceae bacterium]
MALLVTDMPPLVPLVFVLAVEPTALEVVPLDSDVFEVGPSVDLGSSPSSELHPQWQPAKVIRATRRAVRRDFVVESKVISIMIAHQRAIDRDPSQRNHFSSADWIFLRNRTSHHGAPGFRRCCRNIVLTVEREPKRRATQRGTNQRATTVGGRPVGAGVRTCQEPQARKPMRA